MARIHRWTVQKRFNDSDNHDGVITHLEPDILESEVKWVLGSISMWALGSSTKLVEVIEFQWAIADPKRICCWSAALNMPENLENSAVPVIGLEKVSFHSNPKECSNYCTLELIYILARSWSKSFKLGFISRWSKNFQTFQMDLEKTEEPEIKFSTSTGSEKARKISPESTSASLTTLKPLTVWITTTCGKFLKRWNSRPPDLPPEKPACRSGNNS